MLLPLACVPKGQKSNIFTCMFEHIACMACIITFQITFKKSFPPLFLDAIICGLQNICEILSESFTIRKLQ